MHDSERLKGIDVFVAVAEAGSFVGASERLNLTSSAVGKSVTRLERRMGMRLFERTTRRLALTDAGEAFYRTCQRVLAELQEAEQMLRHEGGEPTGPLRIDLPATYGKVVVLPTLFTFLAHHPGIIPHISFTDRFVDLADEGIDVAVRIGGAEAWPTMVGHQFIGHEKRVFCCSPDYLAKSGRPESPDSPDLSAVVYRRTDGSASPWFVRRAGGPVEHIHPPARMVIGSAASVVEAAASGLGVAQLPTWLVADALTRGELIEIMPEHAVQGLPLYLTWLRRRRFLPKVDALLSHLQDHLRI